MSASVLAKRSVASRKAAGFTLIELLVVIAIIGLLASLIVPGLSYAKKQAKIARSKTLIKAIESGLEMFHSNSMVGDSYPPSFWRTGLPGRGNPYKAQGQSNRGPAGNFRAYGAQTLLWALVGIDGRGTAGFDTSDEDLSQLYNVVAGKPQHGRADTFFEVDSDYTKTPRDLGLEVSDGSPDVPVIVDDFDMPVLYFRADLPQRTLGQRYTRADNDGFILARNVQGADHPLKDDSLIPEAAAEKGIDSYFQAFIWNSKVTTPDPRPYNPDSYLLIAAGPDQLYGTTDDLTNFPIIDGMNVDLGKLIEAGS